MSKKVLTLALILSVAVNLLVIGAIAGRWMAGPPPKPFPNHLGWLIRDVGPDIRDQLRPLVREHAQTSRPMRRQLADLQRALMETAKQEPFDADQIAGMLTELRAISLRYQEASHNQMVDILKALSPEQRAEAFNRLNQRRERPDRREGQRVQRPLGPEGP